ncbi:23S rRNA (uracil(1939)-C(5))-methyltransferase RlmD [Enterocloster clostridioformis]|uniref:23S rRNA (uracil(1939)-C(5))-methyltransferase RlmD n=1 Tax=Enterocloster clostridioformis TaxID=1531 RepID=UPI00156F8D63|nr:23S rRNA (uracil(1939)-C(5))-methyltransferase RlmD [Enterocloster clostridioformis]NSD58662.1 23S rRNA (uracil(1939)-C(5))-methyltransferase RlmD [Enterocloster clostridioformis]NSJ12666.1 23S rRNA (uracil(1939)-C(5))-methyltransferase RlmD [Enterocloster clostridioformis]NSJ21476.1 23S rRNA (uracil(1939)-C(5))-methyltransferase RlmD [Enterocloster clostridioformis]NSJ33386.1 23S rRNA (uracil(1939)-C(5))-methyltransferase RlmD [Enterocloster clostridioformis]NSJ61943.1 23S rRNA (uracil(193
MAERMERGMAGKIAGKTAKRMDTGSGTESRKAVDGDKDRAKDSKHKVRDEEGKTGVGKSGKRFAEDGDALSKQRSGEKRRDGSLPRERKGTDGLSAPKKQDGRGLSAGYRREDSKRGGSYGGRGTRRSTSICPVLNLCGGCQLLDMEYAKQLDFKQKQVEELLKGLCPVKPIIGMKDPFHYRNKVHAVFDRDKKGNIISGIYEENTHHVVPVEKCLIENQKADEIIGTIRGMLKSFKIRTYDEDTGFGLLRHVLIRKGFSTGEIMVVLVTASPVFPSKNNFVKALREKHPEITTIVQNINGRGTSMVLGDKEHVLYGKGYIVDELCGCRFRISSKSFYQVNSVQTEILYEKALSLSGLTGRELVVDAYCGIGTIGIIASKAAGKVIGVELNQGAVRDAVNNAKMNGIDNIRFYCNDAGRFLVNMAEQGENADVVIMDPPRSGSTEEFMDAVGKLGAGKVVYVSCNPETLARDVRYMKKLGYRAVEAWPVDMFPETDHVETVVLLSHKKPDGHINVKVEFGEGEGKVPLDNIAKRAESYKPKERVTYKMIKEYIEAKYGFKVHTAYIAEVKRDLGLPMYDAPNAVEKLKQPRKHPTPEKVEAIKDALRYFEII